MRTVISSAFFFVVSEGIFKFLNYFFFALVLCFDSYAVFGLWTYLRCTSFLRWQKTCNGTCSRLDTWQWCSYLHGLSKDTVFCFATKSKAFNKLTKGLWWDSESGCYQFLKDILVAAVLLCYITYYCSITFNHFVI